MPQALINHSLESIAMGVTQQYQEGRHESQVEEMLNCLPSVTRGILRRNPIYKNDDLSIGSIPHAFTYSYDRGVGTEQYIMIIPGDALGTWYVYNANDVSTTWTGTDTYFQIPVGVFAKDAFEALTVGDHTFIVNNTVVVAQTTANNTFPLANYEDWAFYWIKMTTQVVIAQKTVAEDTGTQLEGYTYTLADTTLRKVVAAKDTRPGEIDPDVLTAYKIAAKFATFEAAWINDTDSAFAYTKTITTKWDWEDTNGSLASLGVWKTVQAASDLPAFLPTSLDGFIVRVSGGSTITEDDYYLQYDNSNKTWTECPAPAILLGFDYNTMPHVLYALGTTTSRNFVVDTYQGISADGLSLTGISEWNDREVGDEETNTDPSFVGKVITNLFFYKNRLGFIAGDNIVMSRTGDYGNFYLETVQSILEDGPVDLKVATTDVVSLRHAVATEDALLVFADEAQLSVSSGGAVFGPSTASISIISNYNYAPNMDAKALGNKVYFGSISGGYAQLFEMESNINDITEKTKAEALTIHIPSYIDKGIDKLVGHDVLGQMFIHSENIPNILYVVSSATVGGEKIQQAFHTWEFPDNIAGVHIINNELYLVFEESSLAVISLEVPGDFTNIVYEDVAVAAGSVTDYISGIEFSQFYYRDARKKGTTRGRYQLKTMEYSINEYSAYETVIRNITSTIFDVQVAAFGPLWDDTLLWDDTVVWVDALPDYDRIYRDDSKITIMSSADHVKLVFRNNPITPSVGFELATANIEALFYQRSTRV